MWLIKKAYYRLFQRIMGLSMNLIPWIEPKIIQGPQSMQKLCTVIKERGITSVLVVTDQDLMNLGLLNDLLGELKVSGIKFGIYDQVKPNPTIDNVEEALQVYHAHNCQAIIAFGGGSPIDCAKITGARVARPQRSVSRMRGLFKVIMPARNMGSLLPPVLFAVPTTAGTGSETTIAAVISDARTHEKYPVTDPSIRPRYAVLEPRLTWGLPPSMTAITGMDALSHAVESYIGKFYNNEESRKKALMATVLIFKNLEKAYKDGMNEEARGHMLMAAYYGGFTFTRGGVGYIHGIGHNLGGMYGVPHGLAMSVIMPYVLKWYGEAAHKPLSELADITGVSKPDMNTAEKAKAFIEAIKAMNKRMRIPEKLDCIQDKDIAVIAERALMECNPTYPVPKLMNKKECIKVIKSLKG